jgi:hypothetical protein
LLLFVVIGVIGVVVIGIGVGVVGVVVAIGRRISTRY